MFRSRGNSIPSNLKCNSFLGSPNWLLWIKHSSLVPVIRHKVKELP
jgi:hypothetical protein